MVAGAEHNRGAAGLASCSLYAGGGYTLSLYIIISIIIQQDTTIPALYGQAGK